jgi:hypothetical protein
MKELNQSKDAIAITVGIMWRKFIRQIAEYSLTGDG